MAPSLVAIDKVQDLGDNEIVIVSDGITIIIRKPESGVLEVEVISPEKVEIEHTWLSRNHSSLWCH